MQFRLKVVKGKPLGHCLLFPIGEFMFGRGPECDIRPNSELVSRQHCLLHVEAETVFVRDLGSRNGTLVNGQVVLAEHQLAHGDTVQIGPLVLEVFLDDVPVEGNESIEDTTVMNQDATAEQSVLADTSDQFKVNEQPIVVD